MELSNTVKVPSNDSLSPIISEQFLVESVFFHCKSWRAATHAETKTNKKQNRKKIQHY